MSDWWANKMGAPKAAPVERSYPQQPQQYQLPPPGYQRQGLGGGQEETYSGPITGENLAQVAMTWKGGQGTKTETEQCPGCGSNNFFSRKNTGSLRTMAGSAHPMEHCFDCGYPIHQTGSGF